ncbi:MAG TPA: hypothetical protein VNJ04_15335 [Gemmatimonadaceae bacterium]|nr:hypothetical protein [Gemmatimonadaceae bacterium]
MQTSVRAEIEGPFMKDVRASVDVMKQAIRAAAVSAVKQFSDETGLTPADIRVRMVELTSFGKGTERIVDDVEIDLGTL